MVSQQSKDLLQVNVQEFDNLFYAVYAYSDYVFVFDCDRDAEVKGSIYHVSIMMLKFFFDADLKGKIIGVYWTDGFTYSEVVKTF